MTLNTKTDTNNDAMTIKTERLHLLPARVDVIRAAAAMDRSRMAELLNAEVTADWPPDLLQDALTLTADHLESGEWKHPWSMYFMMLAEPYTLIGNCGFKSPPMENGAVELGYSVVRSHQRRGNATEATQGLIDFAFGDPRVTHVIAETLPDLVPSLGVMEKVGMTFCCSDTSGASGEPHVVRYEIRRHNRERCG